MDSRKVKPELIETQGYTLAELRWRLHQARGRRVPQRTLYHWLGALGIEPDESGLYSGEDLQVLRRLVLFLRRRPSIEAFQKIRIREIQQCQQTSTN